MAAKVSGSRIPGRHTQLEDGLGGLDLASNCTRPFVEGPDATHLT
jgi:hypothetical protein